MSAISLFHKFHGNKPASTYETASTRRFYRGRTETVRTCSPELVAWCQAMTNPNDQLTVKFFAFSLFQSCYFINRKKKKDNYFIRAANRHIELMSKASENEGCDRHLFGLSMIAYLTGKPFELSNDPSWIKRY